MLRMMFFALLGCVASVAAAQTQAVHHQLEVTLDPVSHRIEVIDQISLPATDQSETVFLLHENLKIIDAPSSLKPLNAPAALQAYQANMPVPVKAYVIKNTAAPLTLHYAGIINHSLAEPGEEYARSFGETPGVIGPQGVFLAATSAWYPVIQNAAINFSMQVSLPPGWKAVSQGQRIDADKSQGWSESSPQEEIYLIAAEYNEYSKSTGAVEAMAFLRKPDAALANKYLDVTAQYIEMYRKLIGPYPYKKFALVENFWETGYGMPSFTLLGPKVIRLPFILHSSYPHEILHNW